MREDLDSSLSTHMCKKGRTDGKRGRREKKQASKLIISTVATARQWVL